MQGAGESSKKHQEHEGTRGMYSLLPDFNAVDDVLPKDIAARTNGGQRIEIGVGYPNGKGGVLLSECLSGFYGSMEEMTDIATDRELDDTEQESQQGYEEEEAGRGISMTDVHHGHTGHDGKGNGPKVVAQVFHADDPAMEPFQVMLDDKGQD